MNAFWLDDDPADAAAFHCDKHTSRMTLETAQALSGAMRINGYTADFLYDVPTNSPIIQWAGETKRNWLKLYRLCQALNREYMKRFDKDAPHESWQKICQTPIESLPIPDGPLTDPPQCVSDAYTRENYVEAYKLYYANEKWHNDWFDYKYTVTPNWLYEYYDERIASGSPLK